MTVAVEALDNPCASPRDSQELTDQQLLERFTRQNDAAAFEILVRRHGPMVLGVCRRVLENLKDAEDAFQDTFVVLVRKADSLGKPEKLASWLHGVAYRISLKSKARASQQSRLEMRVITMARDAALPLETGPDLMALDEELQRLPEKFRLPLVLCYLEGLTNEEAARRLGLPVGSISYQLARGRELLRKRLSRRQGALSVQTFALLLARDTAPAEISNELVESTVAAALRVASDSGDEQSLDVPVAVAAAAAATLLTAQAPTSTSTSVAIFSAWSKRKILKAILLIVAVAGLAVGAVMGAQIYGTSSANEQVAPDAPSQCGSATSCH